MSGRVTGKSGCTVDEAKAKFSTEHYSPVRAKAELEHLRAVLAKATPPEPEPVEQAPRRPRRIYGPHRPEDAPTTVTIFQLGDDLEAPIPEQLRIQREQINRMAATHV